MRTKPVPLLLASAVALVLLSACVPIDDADPGTSGTATAGPTAGPTTSASSTPSPSPAAPDAIPLSIPCTDVVTPDEMYAYSPLLALQDEPAVTAGSLASRAVDEYRGTACSWVHETSGSTIVISVAQLSDAAMSELRAELAASSTAVSDFGGEGYFDVGDGGGEAQYISGSYWVTATSPQFFEAADVQPLIAAVSSRRG